METSLFYHHGKKKKLFYNPFCQQSPDIVSCGCSFFTLGGSRSKSVSLRNVTLELGVEKEALAALYGRDGAGLDNLQQVSLLVLLIIFGSCIERF